MKREWSIEEGQQAFIKLLNDNPELRKSYLKGIQRFSAEVIKKALEVNNNEIGNNYITI